MDINFKSLAKAIGAKITIGGLALVSIGGAIFTVYKDGMESVTFWAFFVSFALFAIIFTITFFVKGNKKDEITTLEVGNNNPALDNDNNSNSNESKYDFLIKYLKDYDISERIAQENIEEYRKLNQFLIDNNSTLQDLKKSIENKQNIPLLTEDHGLFTTIEVECIDRIDRSRYEMDQSSSTIRKSIPDYIELVVRAVIDQHKQYVLENQNIINNDTEKLSVQQYLKAFLDTRNKTIELARQKKFHERLIYKFSKIIENRLDRFKDEVIEVCSYSINYNNYMRMKAILDAVVRLILWITYDKLEELLNMNGDLDGNH